MMLYINPIMPDIIQVHQSGMTASDWTAIFALVVSIATLIWQGHIRNKDLRREREEKVADDKMRKWTAEYPHKLKLFTDFYDTLFRFVDYTVSVRQRTMRNGGDRMDMQIHVSDLLDFELQINRIDEGCKILFSKDVQTQVHEVYVRIHEFINRPIRRNGESMKELAEFLENSRVTEEYNQMKINLHSIQEEIKNQKIAPNLRNLFIKELELSGGENE